MKNNYLFFSIVALTIIVFDAVASISSKMLEFDYTSLSPVSSFLYTLAGFLGCKYFNFINGVFAGFVAGLADSTLGWTVSTLIAPYIPFQQPAFEAFLILQIIAVVSLTGAFWGTVGSSVFILYKKLSNKNS